MENLEEILKIVDDFVWGPVMLVLLVGTGIFLTFRLKRSEERRVGKECRL